MMRLKRPFHPAIDPSTLLLVSYDVLAISGAIILSLILRFEHLPLLYLRQHTVSLPAVLITYIVVFSLFRLYRYQWQFAGMDVLGAVVVGNAIATVAMVVLQVYLDGQFMPRSVIILTFILGTALVGGMRLILRSAYSHDWLKQLEKYTQPSELEPKRTVILGSGQSTVEVLTALANECAGRYRVIGILDNDPRFHGKFLRGIRVLGELDLLYELLQQHEVDEIIVALPESDNIPLREYVLACCRHKVAVRVVPMIAKLLENPSASRGRLRVHNVTVEDIMHQAHGWSFKEQSWSYVTGARVLVTGAGGSIGSELCRQILRMQPERLILFGHGEYSIYRIERELQATFPAMAARIVTVIGDVRDEGRLKAVMEHYHPQFVFHAAAHKHVPMMEDNAAEAVGNNIGGTRNMIRLADQFGVVRMVMISTDKAVYPSSVMGATKFLCEEMARARLGHSQTDYLIVRFGNVLGSRGSVLPLFQEQVMLGGPVTVTHRETRRYFMTIPEAASLVLVAGGNNHSGNLYILDMGQPVRILDLAEDVIRLAGMEPHQDIAIEFCGLRPGEKLSEELFYNEERALAIASDHMYVLERPQYLDPKQLDTAIDDLLIAAATHDEARVKAALAALIPSYTPGGEAVELGKIA